MRPVSKSLRHLLAHTSSRLSAKLQLQQTECKRIHKQKLLRRRGRWRQVTRRTHLGCGYHTTRNKSISSPTPEGEGTLKCIIRVSVAEQINRYKGAVEIKLHRCYSSVLLAVYYGGSGIPVIM